MPNTKPTIVLIGAGWHTPQSYTKLTTRLRQAGFEVFVPRLLAMNGSRPPNAGLKDDSRMIHDYVESLCEAGRHVLVLMHSYGGHVGTDALLGLAQSRRAGQHLPGGVVQLVYMAAHAMLEGQSMVDNVKEFGQMDLMQTIFEFGEDMVVTHRDPRNLVVGKEASDDEAAVYMATFAPWNGQTLYDGIDQCAWREVPTAYIHATNDFTLPYDYQKSMVGKMRKEGRDVETFTIDTGHCPNLTATDEVVSIVEQIAARIGS